MGRGAPPPQAEGYRWHHGFWGWHGASLTVPIFRRDEGHAVVGQIHFELVPEDQTHTLLRAHADTPTARQLLEQMMGDNEVPTGKRGASHPTLKTRERAASVKRREAASIWRPYFGMLLEQMKRPNLTVTVGDEQSEDASEQERRLGAPRLEERSNWPTKLAKLHKWEQKLDREVPQETAAALVGVGLSTLRAWQKRRNSLAR